MPSVAVIKELMSLGLSGDALVAALERIESAEIRGSSADNQARDEQAERRRERDRLRKSAERLRKSADRADSNIINNNYINNNTPLSPQSADFPQTEQPSELDLFETSFWPSYPRKIGKGTAKRVWKTAIRKTSPETIIAAAKAFAAQCAGKDLQYVPHASSWLNGERWQDADLQPCAVPSSQPAKQGVYVMYGTDAGDAWERKFRVEQGRPPPRDSKGGWYFPTEYPQPSQIAAE